MLCPLVVIGTIRKLVGRQFLEKKEKRDFSTKEYCAFRGLEFTLYHLNLNCSKLNVTPAPGNSALLVSA